jgi:hypothetical protein
VPSATDPLGREIAQNPSFGSVGSGPRACASRCAPAHIEAHGKPAPGRTQAATRASLSSVVSPRRILVRPLRNIVRIPDATGSRRDPALRGPRRRRGRHTHIGRQPVVQALARRPASPRAPGIQPRTQGFPPVSFAGVVGQECLGRWRWSSAAGCPTRRAGETPRCSPNQRPDRACAPAHAMSGALAQHNGVDVSGHPADATSASSRSSAFGSVGFVRWRSKPASRV